MELCASHQHTEVSKDSFPSMETKMQRKNTWHRALKMQRLAIEIWLYSTSHVRKAHIVMASSLTCSFFLLVGVTDSVSQWAPCPSLCYTSTHFWNRALPGWRLQSHPFVSHWSHQKHHFRISENKYFSKKILLCMRMKLLRCSWM